MFGAEIKSLLPTFQDEENIVSRNIIYWKEVWQRLTQRIQLDQTILEGETTFKAATANGNPEEQ